MVFRHVESYYPTLPVSQFTWAIPPLGRVHLAVEGSVHYSLYSDAAWNSTLPSGGGLLHSIDTNTQEEQIYSISMFHQLRCINIVRREILQRAKDRIIHRDLPPPSRLSHHCMNYLRQMILCQSDVRLQSCRSDRGSQITVAYVTHTCNDWSAVYDAAEENERAYLARRTAA